MGWGTPKICSPSGSQRSFPQYMKINQYGSLNRHKGTAEPGGAGGRFRRPRDENAAATARADYLRAKLSPAERRKL